MKTKKCCYCKEVLPVTEFYKSHAGRHLYKRQPRCKRCQREYRSRPEVRERDSECQKRYRQSFKGRSYKRPHPVTKEEQKARNIATGLRRRGKLKPAPCEQCGESKVNMHHPDYNKPTEIIWLCCSCHRRLHVSLNKLEELFEGVVFMD